MPRCCFLSMDSLEGYVADDYLAIEPLLQLGWQVDTVSWRDTSVDWNDFDAVVIRTTWDYQREPDKFLDVLREIEASKAQLENSLETVNSNLDKTYLRGLGSEGVQIVRTIWDANYDAASFGSWQSEFKTDDLIIKPTVSSTAEYTYRLKAFEPELIDIFAGRPFMVQPFMPSVISEGEHSLFYFSGEFSHAIRKSPKPADFRVQEEHGGIITTVKPTEDLLRAGRRVVDMISPTPLYARVDFVRVEADNFALMELELIEPALYLRMDAGAPGRFAAAIDGKMNHAG